MAGPRILFVEDEFLIRITLSEVLADEGYEVTEAATAEEALALVEAGERFALLMTDVQLAGGMDGPTLVERVRRIDADVQVIYMTGRPDTMAHDSVRDVVIAKPYTPAAICQAAARILGR
jgi:CheY-like chemotaxis protein